MSILTQPPPLLPAHSIHIFHILTTSSYCSLTIIIGNAGYTANIHADKHDDPLEMEDEDFRQQPLLGEALRQLLVSWRPSVIPIFYRSLGTLV